MSDLAEFLLARIAEDEAVARDAGSGPWQWEQGYGEMCNDVDCPFGSLMQTKEDGKLYQLMDVHGYDVHEPWQGAAHIARHDPARVLAECAVKRRIVAAHQGKHLCPLPPVEWSWVVANEPYTGEVCGELALLALPYADHPDWREEWRP